MHLPLKTKQERKEKQEKKRNEKKRHKNNAELNTLIFSDKIKNTCAVSFFSSFFLFASMDEFDELIASAKASNLYSTQLLNHLRVENEEIQSIPISNERIMNFTYSPSQSWRREYTQEEENIERKLERKINEIDLLYQFATRPSDLTELWKQHVERKDQFQKKVMEIKRSAGNIKNIMNQLSEVKTLDQVLQNKGQSAYCDMALLTTKERMEIKLEHKRRLHSSLPGQWWRSQLAFLENDEYGGYVAPHDMPRGDSELLLYKEEDEAGEKQ